MYIWGGASPNQVEMYEDDSPVKKVDKGKNVYTVGGPPPRIYIFKGVGLILINVTFLLMRHVQLEESLPGTALVGN